MNSQHPKAVPPVPTNGTDQAPFNSKLDFPQKTSLFYCNVYYFKLSMEAILLNGAVLQDKSYKHL